MNLHPYHCVLCGTQLHDIDYLGLLECPSCKQCFLPTVAEGSEFSLSWTPEPGESVEEKN